MNEELGIESVKGVTKHLIELVKAGIESKKDDGRISTGEWIGMIDEFIPLITDFTKSNQILAELKDMSTSEGKELSDYVIGLGIVGEKASKIIKLTVDYIAYQIDGYLIYLNPLIEEIKALKSK